MALTIAGSDSGGGAGIQADLKTFQAFGVFGTSALTAVTAQNTRGVRAVRTLDPEFVREQIEAVCEDLPPAACKTGMLANAEIIAAVAGGLGACGPPPLVVDPVMVATSGDRLLDEAAVGTLVGTLLPLATVVTPNVPEAEALTGMRIRGEDDLGEAARALCGTGARAALVKGGHLPGAEVVDVLWDGARERWWRSARIETRHTHGTGCTLSAAIAAGLALGEPLEDAVGRALDFTRRAIERAPGLGSGHGPLEHGLPSHHSP